MYLSSKSGCSTPDCVGGVGGQTDNEFMYFNKCVLIN